MRKILEGESLAGSCAFAGTAEPRRACAAGLRPDEPRDERGRCALHVACSFNNSQARPCQWGPVPATNEKEMGCISRPWQASQGSCAPLCRSRAPWLRGVLTPMRATAWRVAPPPPPRAHVAAGSPVLTCIGQCGWSGAQGRTALHHCMPQGFSACVVLLLNAGADHVPPTAPIPAEQWTPAHLPRPLRVCAPRCWRAGCPRGALDPNAGRRARTRATTKASPRPTSPTSRAAGGTELRRVTPKVATATGQRGALQ